MKPGEKKGIKYLATKERKELQAHVNSRISVRLVFKFDAVQIITGSLYITTGHIWKSRWAEGAQNLRDQPR